MVLDSYAENENGDAASQEGELTITVTTLCFFVLARPTDQRSGGQITQKKTLRRTETQPNEDEGHAFAYLLTVSPALFRRPITDGRSGGRIRQNKVHPSDLAE